MATWAVLQARMSSTRLPGKVMRPILGQPMLCRQVERIRRSELLDGIALATSTDPADDIIAETGSDLGLEVVRGPLDDVLARFVMAIERLRSDVVVRLTADCPLTSPVVIDEVIRSFMNLEVDYCSNTLQPTYPDGLDVEVVRPAALLEVATHSVDVHEHEHVTLGVYRQPERFRVANVAGNRDLSDLRWTVDTPEDFDFVTRVYESLYPHKPNFDIDDILELLASQPDLRRSTQDAARNAALVGLDTGAMNA